jgi:multiple sugar transport system substrate-binding protein
MCRSTLLAPSVGVVLVLSVLLAACMPNASSREEPTAPSPEVASSNEKVQIRWFVGLGTGTSTAAQAVEETFVEAFNNSQDDIELILEVSPGGGVYRGADLLGP